MTYLVKVVQHVRFTHADHIKAGHVRPVPEGVRPLSVPPAMLAADSQSTPPPSPLPLVTASLSIMPDTLRDSNPHVTVPREPLGSPPPPLDSARPSVSSPALPVEQPIVLSGRVRRPPDRYRPGSSAVDVRGKECNSVTQQASAHKYRAT